MTPIAQHPVVEPVIVRSALSPERTEGVGGTPKWLEEHPIRSGLFLLSPITETSLKQFFAKNFTLEAWKLASDSWHTIMGDDYWNWVLKISITWAQKLKIPRTLFTNLEKILAITAAIWSSLQNGHNFSTFTCAGDSGGPIYIKTGEHYSAIAIVSQGIKNRFRPPPKGLSESLNKYCARVQIVTMLPNILTVETLESIKKSKK